jgi:SAM-dependent methyltransferase
VTYEAKSRYGDQAIVDAYDDERFSSRKGRWVDKRERAIMRAALAAAGIAPPDSVLDVPSGTGRLSFDLAAAGFRVTGADVSEAMLERSRAKARSLPDDRRPTFRHGDAEALPFDVDVFDAVVSLRLAGHLPPEVRVRVLREFGRVSRGPIVVAMYDRRALQGILRRRTRRPSAWHAVSSKEIADEADAAGLQVAARFHLLPLISETVAVLFQPRD